MDVTCPDQYASAPIYVHLPQSMCICHDRPISSAPIDRLPSIGACPHRSGRAPADWGGLPSIRWAPIDRGRFHRLGQAPINRGGLPSITAGPHGSGQAPIDWGGLPSIGVGSSRLGQASFNRSRLPSIGVGSCRPGQAPIDQRRLPSIGAGFHRLE